ncbi:LOW QUALITY PROTEIN: leucine-rich repeat-containing protein 69 [Neoarius graeffei]|uniref:LOW QUALITY PROTEIN: leucine-rich repeat-containing protein 69 n=1 Tax=Neoarius graeffei TaxID=443677 RepID=UPI00298C8CE6|nr:LOW QUALITY PROTEIN: leucine-rich repeat-containing protein 69 [Neoarius graeffei]
MANDLVIQALKANAKSLNLSSRNITELSEGSEKLTGVLRIHLNNNCLWDCNGCFLYVEMGLTELNLGSNVFEEVPLVLKYLHSLKKLHLFRDQISRLHPEVLEGLSNLIVLNLSHNKIKIIPKAIKSLSSLERFSIADNQLEEIPAELGLVSKLTEMNVARNKLSEIPQELCKLTRLRKLSLARNSLRELPEGILGWKNLKMLDIAGNHLSKFPVDFHILELEELYFERNDLIRFELFTSTQEEEVLSLKVRAARFILKEHLNKSSTVSMASLLLPDIQTMLSQFGRCAVCFEPFLTTWLECMQFINLRKDIGMKNSQTIPVRVLLCSYSCFNKSSHSYYSVTKVKPEEVPSHTSVYNSCNTRLL